MTKQVLIINQFACTTEYTTGAGERFYYLTPYFKKAGFETTIVAGAYNHLLQKIPPTPKLFNPQQIDGGTFIWVRLKKYENKKYLGRIISWFEFLFKLMFFRNKVKPDVVVVSSLSLLSGLYGCYIKMRYGSKFIFEVRDIWPLTPVLLGGFSKRNPFILFMKAVEWTCYRFADELVAVLPKFDLYFEENFSFKRPFTWIPNAIKVGQEITPTSLQFDSSKFNVVHTGAMGTANALHNIIGAAKLLKDRPEIQIRLIGQGPDKAELEREAKEHNLNITFYPKVPKTEVPSILSQGDVSFICWNDRLIYRFGVSANKYNDYMLAKIPIISVSSMAGDPADMANCGIQAMPDNPENLRDAIIKLYEMEESERKELGINGYNYLMEKKTYDAIAKQYIALLSK